MVGTNAPKLKTFKGATCLRYRLVVSTLSSTPVRVTNIREDDDSKPGLSASEVSFIRLLDKISSGSTIQINETGTTLTYKPGILIGGERLVHECHPSRATAYYAEPLLMLAPFCKYALYITLKGPTHSEMDICADTLSAVTVPLLRRLTKDSSLSPMITVKKRACCSSSTNKDKNNNGNGRSGMVILRCDVITGKKIAAIDLISNGVIKRIRGIAFGNRISPGHVNRMIDTARGILNRFSPDVYIHTDHGNEQGCGIGFGLHLIAEDTQGGLLGTDWMSSRSSITPEKVAETATSLMLEEIEFGGTVDSNHICFALLFAAVSDSDLSRIRIGRLSETAVTFLRDLETFFGVKFSMRIMGGAVPTIEDEEDEEESSDEEDVRRTSRESGKQEDEGYGIVMSCIGVGLSNTARQRF